MGCKASKRVVGKVYLFFLFFFICALSTTHEPTRTTRARGKFESKNVFDSKATRYHNHSTLFERLSIKNYISEKENVETEVASLQEGRVSPL